MPNLIPVEIELQLNAATGLWMIVGLLVAIILIEAFFTWREIVRKGKRQ